MFKLGEKVVINKNAINENMIGKKFTFGGYLKEPQSHGGKYQNIDCILIDEHKKLYYGCSDVVDKVLDYDTSFDGTYIKVNGHKTIAEIKLGSDSFVGVAKCSPEDKFSLGIGVNLAVNRAFDNYFDKLASCTKVKPPKDKLPINTRVTIEDAGCSYSPGSYYIDSAIKEGSLVPEFKKYHAGSHKYFDAYDSHAVPNVKFAVRGYAELLGNKVYFIQELGVGKHELFVYREDGIAVDQ